MKKKIIKLLAIFTNLSPSIALAFKAPIIGISDKNPSILSVIERVVDIILGITGALAALFIIIGGIRYMASQGNAEATEAAKHTILYSVIGLLVIVLSFIIVIFVSEQLAPAVAK